MTRLLIGWIAGLATFTGATFGLLAYNEWAIERAIRKPPPGLR